MTASNIIICNCN